MKKAVCTVITVVMMVLCLTACGNSMTRDELTGVDDNVDVTNQHKENCAPLNALVSKQTVYNGDGTIRCWKEYVYNEMGDLESEALFGSSGRKLYWIEYSYDEDNNLEGVYRYEGAGVLKDFFEYTYDEHGYCVSMCDDEGEIEAASYTYDEHGNVLTHTYYTHLESSEFEPVMLTDSYEYTYDEKGNILSELREYTGYSGDTETAYCEYTYDVLGNCTSCSEDFSTTIYDYTTDGILQYSKRSHFNFNGNSNYTEHFYDEEGKPLKEVDESDWCEYTYGQEEGENFISMCYYDEDGKENKWHSWNAECDENWNILIRRWYDLGSNTVWWVEYDYLNQSETKGRSQYKWPQIIGTSGEKYLYDHMDIEPLICSFPMNLCTLKDNINIKGTPSTRIFGESDRNIANW